MLLLFEKALTPHPPRRPPQNALKWFICDAFRFMTTRTTKVIKGYFAKSAVMNV